MLAGKLTNSKRGAFARGQCRLGNVHAIGGEIDHAARRRHVSMGSSVIHNDRMARVPGYCRKIGRLVWVRARGLSENGTHRA